MAACSFFMIGALVLGVGIPNHMVLRHIVQTLPLWLPVIIGLRRSSATGWIGLPLFIFWLVLMALIWVYLLGISNLISGTFSSWEIAMTILVGLGSVMGIAAFVRSHSALSVISRIGSFVFLAAVQVVCFRISFLPLIAHR
jgi:hypothetical protein